MAERWEDELDSLQSAILLVLSEVPPEAEMSLPRLSKRLGAGVSVLMRQLTFMGSASLGGRAGPGWVRMSQSDGRWLAALTALGRERIAASAGSRRPRREEDDDGQSL